MACTHLSVRDTATRPAGTTRGHGYSRERGSMDRAGDNYGDGWMRVSLRALLKMGCAHPSVGGWVCAVYPQIKASAKSTAPRKKAAIEANIHPKPHAI